VSDRGQQDAPDAPTAAAIALADPPLDPRRFRVFGLTWLSYASYYLTRKNYALAKVSLQQAYGLTTDQLGTIDSAHSAAYAVGQFVWGWAADRIGPRRVLGIGMLGTALCSIAFGMSTTFLALLVLWTLNGLLQATGWSPNVKAMTGWFADGDRGRIMGMWTTNYTVGSFVANPFAGMFMDALGWQWAFFGPAIPVAFVGLLLIFFLPELEAARGDDTRSAAQVVEQNAAAAEVRRAARLVVLKNPFLWALGVAYFFLKLTRYFFWNWAPYYMETVLKYDKWHARWVPLAFEVGGVVGAMTIGWISDKYLRGRRMPAAVVSTLLLGVVLWSYGGIAASGVWANVAILLLFGFLLFGPDAIVSATAAQDIGGPGSAAIAAGVINGLGSVGQIVSGKIAPKASAINDWSSVFRTLGVFTAISAVVLLPFWNRGRRAAKG
jgi:OPA family sugar phosphate sensor protein UhpC-like MFS transporter